MADTIRGRQMLVALCLGLPPDILPDEKHVQAEALAWLQFQAEFPKVKLSPKTAAILGLLGASSASYLPMVAAGIAKAAAMKQAKREQRPGFKVPPINPADQRNGAEPPPASQPGLNGDELVILSGVQPDGGKLSFN